MKPTTEPLYWFARGNGVIHTGVTKVGQQTDTGLDEFEYGTNEIVATKLDKYKDELPVETEDEKPAFYLKDGKVACIQTLSVTPIEIQK